MEDPYVNREGLATRSITTLVDSTRSQIDVSFSSSGDNTVITGVTGRTIKPYRIAMSFASAVDVIFKDGSTAIAHFKNITAIVLDPSADDNRPLYTLTEGNSFVINISSGVTSQGYISYTR